MTNHTDFKRLLNLIGHSVHHGDVKTTLIDFNVQEPPVAVMQPYGSLDIPKIYNEEMGVEIEFTTRIACQDLKSFFTNDKWELIFDGIRFWKLSVDRQYPFSLCLGEDAKVVSKKLDSKPFRKSKGYSSGFVYWYYKDKLEVIAYLDDSKALESFYVKLQDVFSIKSARLKASFSEQQKNLTTEHLEIVRALSSELPTKVWLERMTEENEEGEVSPFTTQNIQTSEKILKEFISALEIATEKKKVSQIQAAIKKTVIALNKLNTKNNYFIETLEREELVNFITRAIKLTGFIVDEGVDVTENWREW